MLPVELLEKYNIEIVDGRRYYLLDVTNELPTIEHTTPYFFKYKDIEVRSSSWIDLTLKVLSLLDERNTKSDEELLALKYDWSKTNVFSAKKQTNFTKFRNIYLNTNHTASHAMMSFQLLLKTYEIDLQKVYLLIRRHFVVEPSEVCDYVERETIKEFRLMLKLNKFNEEKSDLLIKNIYFTNKLLDKRSGYNNFFLFDDYMTFNNYKIIILNGFKEKYRNQDKRYKAVNKCLTYLDKFYRNRKTYHLFFNKQISKEFIYMLIDETNRLFIKLSSSIVKVEKLYSRMLIVHGNELAKLGELNNLKGVTSICDALLPFYYKNGFISKTPMDNISSEAIVNNYIRDLDYFSIDDINNFILKNQLNNISNINLFIAGLSDKFVLIDYNKLVSKSSLNISEFILEKIKNELLFLLNSLNYIYSEEYNGYDSLPKIHVYNRNKFLLLGIVRTYFADTFCVDDFEGNYNNIKYKISIK